MINPRNGVQDTQKRTHRSGELVEAPTPKPPLRFATFVTPLPSVTPPVTPPVPVSLGAWGSRPDLWRAPSVANSLPAAEGPEPEPTINDGRSSPPVSPPRTVRFDIEDNPDQSDPPPSTNTGSVDVGTIQSIAEAKTSPHQSSSRSNAFHPTNMPPTHSVYDRPPTPHSEDTLVYPPDNRSYEPRRGDKNKAHTYYHNDTDDTDDLSPLLGSASGDKPQRNNGPGGKSYPYDTFPDVPKTYKSKPDAWPTIVKYLILAAFLVAILQPLLSAGVRYLDPHEGIESRQHQLEHKQWESERIKEEQRKVVERKKWAEEEEHMNEHRRARLDEWEEDRKIEMELRRREKDEWNRERFAEQEQRAKERAEWELERRIEEERKAREREEWEEERRDTEAWRYRHSGAFWTTPVMEKCAAYGIRQYGASLTNIPNGYDPRKTCEYTNVTIQDHTYNQPRWCDDQGEHGLRGYWWVDAGDSGELGCRPYWNTFADKGCTGPGSGKHRFESSLQGLVKGEVWETLCATAPATINNVNYEAPTYCEYRGGNIIWGLWDVDDQSC